MVNSPEDNGDVSKRMKKFSSGTKTLTNKTNKETNKYQFYSGQQINELLTGQQNSDAANRDFLLTENELCTFLIDFVLNRMSVTMYAILFQMDYNNQH